MSIHILLPSIMQSLTRSVESVRFLSIIQLVSLLNCHLGFSITPEELLSQVTSYISSNTIAGWNNLGATISGVKAIPSLRWASPLEIKNAVEKAFLAAFGPKQAAQPKGKVRLFCSSLYSLFTLLIRTPRKKPNPLHPLHPPLPPNLHPLKRQSSKKAS